MPAIDAPRGRTCCTRSPREFRCRSRDLPIGSQRPDRVATDKSRTALVLIHTMGNPPVVVVETRVAPIASKHATSATRTRDSRANRDGRPWRRVRCPTTIRNRRFPKIGALQHRAPRVIHRPGALVAARSTQALPSGPLSDRPLARNGLPSVRSNRPINQSARPSDPGRRSNGKSQIHPSTRRPGAASLAWRFPHPRQQWVVQPLARPAENGRRAASPNRLTGPWLHGPADRRSARTRKMTKCDESPSTDGDRLRVFEVPVPRF